MNPSTDHSFSPEPGSCEAFQWEISQALDEKRLFSPDTLSHLQNCPECAAFAADWHPAGTLAGMLAPSPPALSGVAERVAQAIVLATQPASVERPQRSSRFFPGAGALIILGALSWWLLDPKAVPPASRSEASSAATASTISLRAARLEEPLRREQAALRKATIQGLSEVREVLDLSALALQ